MNASSAAAPNNPFASLFGGASAVPSGPAPPSDMPNTAPLPNPWAPAAPAPAPAGGAFGGGAMAPFGGGGFPGFGGLGGLGGAGGGQLPQMQQIEQMMQAGSLEIEKCSK